MPKQQQRRDPKTLFSEAKCGNFQNLPASSVRSRARFPSAACRSQRHADSISAQSVRRMRLLEFACSVCVRALDAALARSLSRARAPLPLPPPSLTHS
eukprot:3936051-Rhodomonas_salina.1